MAGRGDGLAGIEEVPHEREHALVELQVLRRPPAGDDQRVVGGGLDGVPVERDGKVVAALLAVGLLALEVVNRRGDEVALLLVGTDDVDLVADHLQNLQRDHRFVVFDEVADEHEDSLDAHGHAPSELNHGGHGEHERRSEIADESASVFISASSAFSAVNLLSL